MHYWGYVFEQLLNDDLRRTPRRDRLVRRRATAPRRRNRARGAD